MFFQIARETMLILRSEQNVFQVLAYINIKICTKFLRYNMFIEFSFKRPNTKRGFYIVGQPVP